MPQYTTPATADSGDDEEVFVGSYEPFGRRRGAGAPVRRGFIRRGTRGDVSPLAQLLSGASASRGGGGRGGRLRVALLLTLLWQLARSPHTTIRPARYWAELLELDDPENAGARAIRSSLHELERRGFIRSSDRGPGVMPEITLLDESLSGRAYKLPHIQAMEEGPDGDTSYFRVPESFWVNSLHSKLSGAGIAMYLVAMSRAGWGNDPTFWLSPARFSEEYGLSDSTRKKGLKELVDLGVLTQELRSIDRSGGQGHRRFLRSVYTVVASYRAPGATEPEKPSPIDELKELIRLSKLRSGEANLAATGHPRAATAGKSHTGSRSASKKGDR